MNNMLFECEEHGYYRGDTCPVCGKKGKFLMNDRELNSLSRIIAGALRHFPDKLRLGMDGHGWVEISQLMDAIGSSRSGFNWLRLHHIQALVATDPRSRYQIDGGMIRAKYGHSIDVNLDDLPITEADELFYPVTEEEADIVLENGIHPIDRKKVHLSTTIEKAVEAGSVRSENPLIIKVDGVKARENGIDIFQASHDVCVTDSVDAEYLSQVEDSIVGKILKEKNK
jgi:putative RNA 2'-phosphotransferase